MFTISPPHLHRKKFKFVLQRPLNSMAIFTRHIHRHDIRTVSINRILSISVAWSKHRYDWFISILIRFHTFHFKQTYGSVWFSIWNYWFSSWAELFNNGVDFLVSYFLWLKNVSVVSLSLIYSIPFRFSCYVWYDKKIKPLNGPTVMSYEDRAKLSVSVLHLK